MSNWKRTGGVGNRHLGECDKFILAMDLCMLSDGMICCRTIKCKMQICSSCFRKRDVVEEPYDVKRDPLPKHKLKEEGIQTRFYCCGRVPPQGPRRRRHGMFDNADLDVRSDSSIELAVEAYENEAVNVTEILGPEVPFIEDLPEELYQGRTIEIQGKLLQNANRFSINLSTGKDDDSDLALHFNPRVDRHIIIRNHRIRNKWGVEEITSLQHFPFTIGRNFSVLIFVGDEQFLIAINKIHYCAFAFRIPIDKVKSLIILGDITLRGVVHNDTTSYPPKIFKKIPHIIVPHILRSESNKCNFKRKIKTIKAGTKIDIFGRIKILPRAFYVNLQKGITMWPHPIIPFHMNYRLHQPGTHKKEREIIFNSWLNGFWGKEEIITFCPFLPGTDFHLKIVCKSSGFNVFVNDKYIFNYNKRDETDVDSVVINGDVVINKVVLH